MTDDPPTRFRAAALVAAGGAVGAAVRWGVMIADSADAAFPWATLLVNVVGCFMIGLLVRSPRTAVLVLGIGFAGGLTTFSTLSVELAALLRDQDATTAGAYLAATMVLGVTAVLAGRRAAP